MDVLTSNGWGALLMIAAIVGWSALMLLLVYLLSKRRGPLHGQTSRAVHR